MGYRDNQHPHKGHYSKPIAARHFGSSGKGETFGLIQNFKCNCISLVGQTDEANC